MTRTLIPSAVALMAGVVVLAEVPSAAVAQSITLFPIPTASTAPYGITSGPDGNLWFTEYGRYNNKIGKVTTSGTFTEYGVPAMPWDITTGLNGNLEALDNWLLRQPPLVLHRKRSALSVLL